MGSLFVDIYPWVAVFQELYEYITQNRVLVVTVFDNDLPVSTPPQELYEFAPKNRVPMLAFSQKNRVSNLRTEGYCLVRATPVFAAKQGICLKLY